MTDASRVQTSDAAAAPTRLPTPRRARILIAAAIAGLLFGAINLGRPLEDILRVARNAARSHEASGDIVVVGIDDKSLAEVGAYPWTRDRHARLIDELGRLGARRIMFDLSFAEATREDFDAALEAAFARSRGRVTVARAEDKDALTGQLSLERPLARFGRHVETANISVIVTYLGYAWRLPYALPSDIGIAPSMAARLSGVSAPSTGSFPVDYAIDPRSVPSISASEVISGRIPAASLSGKDVIVGLSAASLGDTFLLPGHGTMPGVYLHVLGAETLRFGTPRELPWIVTLLFGLGIAALAVRARSLQAAMIVAASGGLFLLFAPLVLEANKIVTGITPALFALSIVTAATAWSRLRRAYRVRGTVNTVSGLSNLDALRSGETGDARMLIAARIAQYPQIASTLPPQGERVLIDQIATRLTLGVAGQKLYQGDEGVFAWFSDAATVTEVGEHLEALHGFFRSAVTVDDRQIDLSLSFGIDADATRSLANRLGSALVACDEAASEGRRWKAYDPAALKDVAWKLSLLGQLDRAIDTGDFWVAYQPKLDLKTGRICGAEALARWTHPDKGAIAPLDFILAAEQNDRIEKLTRFVLDDAVRAAADIVATGTPFNVAVNLSARLIGDPRFVDTVAAILSQHGLAPANLTLEVTETAALNSGCDNLETLLRLRDMGVKIAIDDYGTGLSTLEYLKKIPATEIKIDQSFIAAVTKSHGDRLMVHSTVQLAHSLGRIVVAEGVEDTATLEALRALGCDHAQGFHIGRPMALYAFTQALFQTDANKRVGSG